MLVTLEGISTDWSEVQSLNAAFPMLVTPDEIVTARSDVQLPNDANVMLVTLEGIVTDWSEVQP